MKTNQIIAALSGFILLALNASGSIGETVEQCTARYGRVVEKSLDGAFLEFQNEGIVTRCNFMDGKCARVSYLPISISNANYLQDGAEPRFSEEQSMRLLNLNRGESSWKQERSRGYNLLSDGDWLTKDGKRYGTVNACTVCIETGAFCKKRLEQVSREKIDAVLLLMGATEIEPYPEISKEQSDELKKEKESQARLDEIGKSIEKLSKQIEP